MDIYSKSRGELIKLFFLKILKIYDVLKPVFYLVSFPPSKKLIS